MSSPLSPWKKNFAVILQQSRTILIRNLLKGQTTISDQMIGHAVMVLQHPSQLLYRGYRSHSVELFKALKNLPKANATAEDLRQIVEILDCTRAVIVNEEDGYKPIHEVILSETVGADFAYGEWELHENEVTAICAKVEADEQKAVKYYSLHPDTIRHSREFPPDAIVHNCVTWIVEKMRETVTSLEQSDLLPEAEDGNVSTLAKWLEERNESRRPD